MAAGNSPWVEGFSDAIGFVAGALLGFGVGQLTGLDLFAPGYGVASMGGIVLVGLGAGLGKRWARQWRDSRQSEEA
jgi:hypothetical protein